LKQKEFWESAEAGKSRIHFVDWKFCECSFTQIFYECIFAGSSKFLVQAYLTNFYEEAYLYKFHQQNVWIILLNYAFPHCGLGRCLVGSEGFLKILSPHPYVGSVGFFYKSIVPTVEGEELLYICKKSLMYLQKSLIRAVWECEWPWNVTWPVCVCIYIYIYYIYIYIIYIYMRKCHRDRAIGPYMCKSHVYCIWIYCNEYIVYTTSWAIYVYDKAWNKQCEWPSNATWPVYIYIHI